MHPAIVPASPPSDVVLDNTLGQTTQPTAVPNFSGVNDYTVDASQGKTVGTNLFFSFSQFSLQTNESVTFTGPDAIQNILARVTGGGVSNIDGTINVNMASANFFLINPAGVIFGPDSFISVPGSFVVTTADYLKFADGTRFTAVPGVDDATLSSAAVTAFGFLSKPDAPGQVTFSGSFLSTPDGANFIVVSGDQTIDGANITAPGGQMTFVAVAGAGEVPADPATLTTTPLSALPPLGTVTFTDFATVSVGTFGAGGGKVEVDAATVNVLENSAIDASMDGISTPLAGLVSNSILIRSDTVLLSDGATIAATATEFGLGGFITIQANNVTLTDGGVNGSQIATSVIDHASGGGISITTDSLTVQSSELLTSTNGSGAAGNININTNSLIINGATNFQAPGILAESGMAGSAGQTATGRGGDVNVVTQQLTLSGGAEISATTFGPGSGGNVTVTASNIDISGFTTDGSGLLLFQSGILAASELPGASGLGGQGGNVTVSTNSLHVSANGLITAGTAGSGNGGDVTVNANSIVLDGSGAGLPTGIAATTSYQTGGKGGDINVSANSLQVANGAEINAATNGTGTGGNVTVTGGSVVVSGPNSVISAETTGLDGGSGGDLRFNVESLSVLNSGLVTAATLGSGKGGSIDITAGQLTADGSGSIRADTSGVNGTVTLAPSVENVTLTLTVLVASDANLNATLANPSQAPAALFARNEATGSDMISTTFSDTGATTVSGGTGPYTGTFQSDVPLAIFNTGLANGTWNLSLSLGGSVNATLESWSLSVNGTTIASNDTPRTIVPRVGLKDSITIALPSTQLAVTAGAGGNIFINAGTIKLTNGGTVTASTHGDGAAGSLTIQANSISIDASHASSNTGFFASAEAGSTGRGGSISISTGELQVTGSSHSGLDGEVVALSQTKAAAGDISIKATDVALDANAVISSANDSSGPAGSVNIKSDNSILLDGGSVITVVALQAQAGVISLSAGDNVELHDGSTITASAGAGGGSIVITTGDEFILDHSSIVATAGLGAGGNITIDPEFIILDHSLISANAAAGAGGNILIEGQYFFDNDSPITATGTTAGSVQISTLPLDIVNALAGLQSGFIDLSSSLQDTCPMRLGTDASSFLMIGRGGIEDSPDDPQEELAARLRQKAKGNAHAR